MPTESADGERLQRTFPFMQLPPELRVMVYKFALQDVVDPILSSDPGDVKRPEPFRGALALLHTSRLLRWESCRPMQRIVQAHRDSLADICHTLVDRMEESIATTPMTSCAHLYDQYGKVSRQHKCVVMLSKAMLRVYLSDTEMYQARDGTPLPAWWDSMFKKPTV
jgi:hypothetical protein